MAFFVFSIFISTLKAFIQTGIILNFIHFIFICILNILLNIFFRRSFNKIR